MLVSLNRMPYQYNPQFRSKHRFLAELEHLDPQEAKLFIRALFLKKMASNERLTAIRLIPEAKAKGLTEIELKTRLSPAEQEQLAKIKQKAKAAMAALQKPATNS